MKRVLPYVIALVFCLNAGVVVLAVDNPAFSVSVDGTLDAENTFNGQSTLVVDWRIQANREGITLRYAQGLRLAYDDEVLQLMTWDGAGVIRDGTLEKNFSPFPGAGNVGDFETDLAVFAARSAPDGLGYLSYLLGNPIDAYDCPQGEYFSLAQVRFAFRAGKSVDDLAAGSIRCMTASELSETSQSTAILLNTAVASYEYLKQEGGEAIGGDRLNAPAITYPNSTVGSGADSDIDGDINDTGDIGDIGENGEIIGVGGDISGVGGDIGGSGDISGDGVAQPNAPDPTVSDAQPAAGEQGWSTDQMPDAGQQPSSGQPTLPEAATTQDEDNGPSGLPDIPVLFLTLAALGAGVLLFTLAMLAKKPTKASAAAEHDKAPDASAEAAPDASAEAAPDASAEAAPDASAEAAPDASAEAAPDASAEAAPDASANATTEDGS